MQGLKRDDFNSRRAKLLVTAPVNRRIRIAHTGYHTHNARFDQSVRARRRRRIMRTRFECDIRRRAGSTLAALARVIQRYDLSMRITTARNRTARAHDFSIADKHATNGRSRRSPAQAGARLFERGAHPLLVVGARRRVTAWTRCVPRP